MVRNPTTVRRVRVAFVSAGAVQIAACAALAGFGMVGIVLVHRQAENPWSDVGRALALVSLGFGLVVGGVLIGVVVAIARGSSTATMVLTVLDGLALFFSVIMRFWQAPLGLVIVLALVVATGLGAWTMALDPRRDALLFDPVPDDRA